jgi:hypothetical protein
LFYEIDKMGETAETIVAPVQEGAPDVKEGAGNAAKRDSWKFWSAWHEMSEVSHPSGGNEKNLLTKSRNAA